jgi:hypothetical protein
VSLPPRSILARLLTTAIIAAAVPLLLGAADQLQEAISRLQGMSPRQRTEITEALRRFDLQLTPAEQQSLRQLDDRINKLSPDDRVRYLATLRRFHNWLDSLPDTVKDPLLAKPPEERMALVKSLIAKYPLPREKTPGWMQFTEFTGGSPFELAAIFKIWQDLTPDQRREVEKLPTLSQRRDNLLKTGVRKRMLREVMPADFRVEDWIPKVEARIDEIRSSDPELKGAVKGAIDRAEKKLEELAKEKSQGKFRARPPILRRLAINLYMLSQDPRPVAADRLDAFFTALPSWVQSSFDSLPADEARRRLTLIYRLVFPHPAEFQAPAPAARPAAITKDSTTAPAPRTGSPAVAPLPSSAPRKGMAQPKSPPRPATSPF